MIKAYDFDVFGSRVKRFQRLMRFKIRDILLVSSLYDSYLFEEDGRLYEVIREEYRNLNLSHSPEITHVANGEEAIELIRDEERFDLIITTMHIEDMHVTDLAKKLRDAGYNQPIILLAYDNEERKEIETSDYKEIFERIFIWQGDYKLLIGIIKYIEDKLNVESDTETVGVQTIILIEDNVKFYSIYLPLIYTEILNQSQRLISEGLNVTHRFLRMRARPKILLCSNYEEAWEYFIKYKDHILGIISDINFEKKGVQNSNAGVIFARQVKKIQDDIPILLQSSNKHYLKTANDLGASFLLKNSPWLLRQLRDFMIKNFSFGDFIFRTPEGDEADRADNLFRLLEKLKTIPEESLLYHSNSNHFSNWLKARTEFWLANQLRPKKVGDYNTPEELRQNLIHTVEMYLEMRQKGSITEFSRDSYNPKNSFSRIGSGSLGGKARGLGFVNSLISHYGICKKFKGIEIYVPSALVLATDVFDQFMEANDLQNFAMSTEDDEELMERFLQAPYFPPDVISKLRDFLELVNLPLAIRSSSLLEDSQFQPFAGVYQTFMIPNNNPDLNVRLDELLQCIKGVFASTFAKSAKDYLKATSYRLEEEKMAVIIQQVVGARHNYRYYPAFAGVAKSYNFYPVPPQKADDGIALVALGLGKTVVDGGDNVRFCPKYPKHLVQFFNTKETLRNSQNQFFALDMEGKLEKNYKKPPSALVKSHSIEKAEKDGTLFYSGSTYSNENDTVYDGISRDGARVVTFAPILKHKLFPLPEILQELLNIGQWGMGTHVEIEFAVNMDVKSRHPKEFAMLQMRPMVLSRENVNIDFEKDHDEDYIAHSQMVLGNGTIDNIHDIVVVDINKFNRAKSKDTAREVAHFNQKLLAQKKPYILIGVGRWGSFDHWLGIPVTWDQISGASVIIESGFKDFKVTPSQGSHFFQNITSFRVGYFTVNMDKQQGYINWDWLAGIEAEEELEFTRHLSFEEQIITKISGSQNIGVIHKPGIFQE